MAVVRKLALTAQFTNIKRTQINYGRRRGGGPWDHRRRLTIFGNELLGVACDIKENEGAT